MIDMGIPDFLRVPNRVPLSPERRAEVRRLCERAARAAAPKHSYDRPRTAPPLKVQREIEAAAARQLEAFKLAGAPPRPPKRT